MMPRFWRKEIGKADMSAVVDDGNKITFRPLSEAIGAEVLGTDLTAPLDDSVKSRLRGALAEYRLLLERDEHIPEASQADFAKVLAISRFARTKTSRRARSPRRNSYPTRGKIACLVTVNSIPLRSAVSGKPAEGAPSLRD